MLSTMWCFSSSFGYLSIVLARQGPEDPTPDPDHLNIRARSRRHLELLQRACPTLAAFPITESPSGRDYAFRLVPVPKALFANALRDLVMALNYVNHKSACSANPDLDDSFQHVLHEVWSATQRFQR